MYPGKVTALIIPARNEALTLPGVLAAVPAEVDHVLVVDNGSTDDTPRIARKCGAKVVSEPRKGYGRACLAGISAYESDPPDIVAFADADGSDDISRLSEFIGLLAKGEADLVLSRRIPVESGAMTFQQRFGNWLATRLIRFLWGHEYKDLGPMRAITWNGLRKLNMADADFGWTVEMQVKALKIGLNVRELPVVYLKRKGGRSKVSGTLVGSLRAGLKILKVIFQEILKGEHNG